MLLSWLETPTVLSLWEAYGKLLGGETEGGRTQSPVLWSFSSRYLPESETVLLLTWSTQDLVIPPRGSHPRSLHQNLLESLLAQGARPALLGSF